MDSPGNYGCVQCVLQRYHEESGAATDYVEVEVDLRKNAKLETNQAFLSSGGQKKSLGCLLLWKELLLVKCYKE